MRKLNNLLFILMAVLCMGTWSSCSDDNDWAPGEAPAGQGVFFPSEQETSISLTESTGTFEVSVWRSTSEGAATVQLTSTPGENAAGIFTVPTEVSFADGETSTTLTVAYQNVEFEVEYPLTISAVDGTPYGITDLQLTVVCPLVWEVVSTNAKLVDNLFEAFGVTGVEITDITVEKHPTQNRYRFKSPYDNSYLEALFGAGTGVLADDFVAPYIELDGETYPGGYFIAAVKLGWRMVNGSGPAADTDWKGFGSIYGNVSENLTSYPLGTYDEANKVFDLGAVFHNIDNEGESYVYPIAAQTLLYLNN